MKNIRWFYHLCVATALIGSAGCAMFLVGAGAGAGAVAYAKGKLTTTETASLNQAWTASLETAKELDYTVTETNKQATTAAIIGRNAQDERLEISLKSITEKTTEVSIRVGMMGDEERSRLVLDRIRRRLK